MGWDFTADSDIQNSLASSLDTAADNFDERVDALYSNIDSMGSGGSWIGEDYDAFNTGVHGYENALDDLSDGIRMYAEHFRKMSTGTETLATELVQIIQNLTGASGGNGGSGGSGGGTGGGTTSEGGDGLNAINAPDNSGQGADANGAGGSTTGSDGTETDAAEEVGFWAKQGNRYTEDWGELSGSVSDLWSDADGLVSGLGATVGTVAEGALFVVDGAVDTVETASDMIGTGWNWLLDAGNTRATSGGYDYWSTVGEDFAENWDFSTVDNFAEGAGVVITGTVRTVVDTAQLVGNVAVDAVEVVGDVADTVVGWGKSLVKWIFD